MNIDEAIRMLEEDVLLPTVLPPPYDNATLLTLLRFVQAWDAPGSNLHMDGQSWRDEMKKARAAVNEALG